MRKKIAYIRTIDKIGRFVIPKDLRRLYGIEDEAVVYIIPTDDGILIRPTQPVDLQ